VEKYVFLVAPHVAVNQQVRVDSVLLSHTWSISLLQVSAMLTKLIGRIGTSYFGAGHIDTSGIGTQFDYKLPLLLR
jgi:hypothetical protein